ncbi:hypothetical protein SEUCBS139899_009641 [Sporothrix eucalyptigena]|uniref:Xylanolytic transcriptional activator regulatory domain-containing protein n=1 Tax=Sporothrix eucalyptigena TaxID=1812306 RepID=A0ABP0C4V8_9PEZI
MQSESAEPGITSLIRVHQMRFEDLMTGKTFEFAINTFLNLMYPLVPLVERSSFLKRLEKGRTNPDPGLFRLCISICAFTMGCFTKKFAQLSVDAHSMILRACQLFAISRLQSDAMDLDSCVSHIFLAMARSAVSLSMDGWSIANEGILRCRELGIGDRERYAGLPLMEQQIRKRTFWVYFIMLITDRLLSSIPHTITIGDYTTTDWSFLVPEEVPDDQPDSATSEASGGPNEPSVISAFIGLVLVYLPAARVLSSGVISVNQPPKTLLRELAIIHSDIQEATKNRPPHLHIQQDRPPATTTERQLDIMRTNIDTSSLFLQSYLVEQSISLYESTEKPVFDNPNIGRPRIWTLRIEAAAELLSCLTKSSPEALESNGAFLVSKIKAIAATLIPREEDMLPNFDEVRKQGETYVRELVQFIEKLDYVSKAAMDVYSVDANFGFPRAAGPFGEFNP